MKTKTLEQLQAELKTAQLKHELAMLQNKNRWDYTNETKLEISKFDKAEKQILAMLNMLIAMQRIKKRLLKLLKLL